MLTKETCRYAWRKAVNGMTIMAKLPTVVPADWVSGPPQGQWTYADYAALPEDGQCYEIVKGVLYMSPAPTPGHQDVKGEIFGYLRQFVKLAGLGRVLDAPTDVELSPGNIVQPDVFVLLNENIGQIGPSRVIGAPDLVVEILSPGTMRHDLSEKLRAYERAQVPEYWVVNASERIVELLVLENGDYRSLGAFQDEEVLPSRIIPDWPVAVKQFFAFI